MDHDSERGVVAPPVADGSDEVDIFERKIRDRERRHRRITTGSLGLALTAVAAFIIVWVATTVQGYKTEPHDSTEASSIAAPTPTVALTADAEPAPPRAEPTAPHPSRLPMCGEPRTPPAMRAMCQLDAPATSVVFECAHPEPMMFWPRAVEWGCRSDVPGRVRPVSIALVFDRQGDMPEGGEELRDGDPRTARRGTVRKVSAKLGDIDRRQASEEIEHLRAAAQGWGCVENADPPEHARAYDEFGRMAQHLEHEREERRRLAMEHEIDCGAHWKIRTNYIDLGPSSLLVIEAAGPLGFELTSFRSTQ